MLIVLRRVGLFCGVAMLVAVTAAASSASASETETTNTVMTVGEMCGGCVKKITKHFEGVKGVASVTCNIKDQTVTVVPEKGTTLSPLALWEIMEEIGKTPKKLESPTGTYTSKPSK